MCRVHDNSSLSLGSVVRTGIATPSSRCHVDGVEVHAAIQDERAVNLISTQVDGKKIELPAILSDKPFKNMGGKCTPSAWRQCPDQAMQSPARRGNKETEDQLANKFTRRRAQLQIEKAGGSVGDVAPKDAAVAAARGGDVQGPGPPRAVGRGHGREDRQGLLRQHEDGRDAVGEAGVVRTPKFCAHLFSKLGYLARRLEC